MIQRNDPCFCNSGKKWKKCHYPKVPTETMQTKRAEYKRKHQILLKTDKEIEGIRKAGHLAAHILEKLCEHAKEGVTTNELNTLANQLHKEARATPAPLNYGHPPFPKSICTSLNEVICHGIPDDRPLKKGDILNIDVTAILNGYYGDCSQMVIVGETTKEKQKLVDVTHDALMRSIEILKPGVPIYKIGETIESYATSFGFSVVHQFVGHGVGLHFHEAPQISHHINRNAILLEEGMTFTIEPMINIGCAEGEIDPEDEWTARTLDRKASAQFEHTLLITKEGVEILTPWRRHSSSIANKKD